MLCDISLIFREKMGADRPFEALEGVSRRRAAPPCFRAENRAIFFPVI
jgi:hypothetical protein